MSCGLENMPVNIKVSKVQETRTYAVSFVPKLKLDLIFTNSVPDGSTPLNVV